MVFKWPVVLSVLWGMYNSGGNGIQRDDIELTQCTLQGNMSFIMMTLCDAKLRQKICYLDFAQYFFF